MTNSDSNFAPGLVDHHVLPDINFNEHCLVNTIYIPQKRNKYIYIHFLHTKSIVKKFNTDFTLNNCLIC